MGLHGILGLLAGSCFGKVVDSVATSQVHQYSWLAQQSKDGPDAWICPEMQDTTLHYFLMLIEAFGPAVLS